MDSLKSPQRKSTQFHFCIRVTPKVLPKAIFQSKGIQNLYKLQVLKGSKRQTVQTMKRNLHQQALQGFYQSQSCYFTLFNYTNFRPYQMTILFSQVNSSSQQQIIFMYKFSTYGLVKNLIENDVCRSTQTIAKDFQTQFYIDFYIQSNKSRLEDKVKRDTNKHILSKRHFKQTQHDDQESDFFRNSLTSNNSPAKSNRGEFSTRNYRLQKNINARSSTPLVNDGFATQRRSFTGDTFNDARSQKLSSNRSMKLKKHVSQNFNTESQRNFFKKYPSTRMQADKSEEDEDFIKEIPISGRIKHGKSNIDKKLCTTNIAKSPNSEQIEKQEQKRRQKEFDLKVFLNMRQISLEEISYQIKKNIILIIFISIIFFIVVSRVIDSVNLSDKKTRKKFQSRKELELNNYEDEPITSYKADKIGEIGANSQKKVNSGYKKDFNSRYKKEKTVYSNKKIKNRKIPSDIKQF